MVNPESELLNEQIYQQVNASDNDNNVNNNSDDDSVSSIILGPKRRIVVISDISDDEPTLEHDKPTSLPTLPDCVITSENSADIK